MIVTTTTRTKPPPATVLHVAGEVDTFAADGLRGHLRCLPGEPDRPVELDLSAVTFMSCTALSVLAEAQARLGSRLVVGTRSRVVTRLLEITGLTSFFNGSATAGSAPAGTHDADDGSPPRARATAAATWTFSRTDLERVRGRLMGVHGCDADEAWRMLARAGAWHGVPVGELVDLLVGGHRTSGRTLSSAAAAAALTVLMRRPDEAGADAGPAQSGVAAVPICAAVRPAAT